ncbi:MAG: porin family protein [Gammaproteobacteria bacterium]|nr:porin family protein [Gammaproteobacteria bacterium]
MNPAQTVALAVSFVLLAGPLNALAGDFYLGGSIGDATLDEDFDGLNVDDSSTAYRIVAGWSFNRHFSLEGGYNDFGDFEQTFDDGTGPMTAKLSADGFILGLAGRLPASERIALTGRAGMFFWDGNAEINDVTQATPEDSNLYVGIGLSFSVSDKLELTGDWTRYELESAASDVYSVGLQYHFR